jgi:hypothetical protein
MATCFFMVIFKNSACLFLRLKKYLQVKIPADFSIKNKEENLKIKGSCKMPENS